MSAVLSAGALSGSIVWIPASKEARRRWSWARPTAVVSACSSVSGGVLFANVRPNAGAPWTGPQALAAGGDNPTVDMTVHGVGFGAYRVGGDLFSASMDRRSNTFVPLGAPLDFDPAQAAGGGSGRPKLAASAAGSAVVVWGELAADLKSHVYMRRIFQGSISAAPQDMTLPSFDGRPGLDADLPDVDMEDDASFAWAVFRQQFDDSGTTRTRMIVRHLRGATFDPPENVDAVGWGEGVNEPKIDINARGEGMSAVTTAGSGVAIFSTLKDQIFRPGLTLSGGTATPEANSTTAYGYDRVAAYTEGNPPVVKGRFYDDSNRKRILPSPGAPVGLTSGQFGTVDTAPGFDLSGDNAGNTLVLFTQGTPGARTVVVAGYDLPPDKPTALSKWTKSRKPRVTWKSDGDAWGPVTYRVEIAGKVVGSTTALKFTSKKKIKFGRKYKFRVTAIDVRGQFVRSSTVNLAIDAKAPSADVSFKRSGKTVTVRSRVSDHGTKKRPASGIASVKISWGDGKTKSGASGTHKYKSGGKKKVRVTVTDHAGNRKIVAKRI